MRLRASMCQVGVGMTWFTDLRTSCTMHPLLMLAREAEAYHQQCQPTLRQKTTRLTRQAAYAGLGTTPPQNLCPSRPATQRSDVLARWWGHKMIIRLLVWVRPVGFLKFLEPMGAAMCLSQNGHVDMP